MITALGIDPGLTTGFCLARWEDGKRKAVMVRAFQADYGSAAFMLELLLDSECRHDGGLDAVQVEAYDSRRRGTMTRGWTARQAHALIDDFRYILGHDGVRYHVRQVSNVETWACCGDRMSRAGITLPAKMKDAESAGWHALYTACKDLGMPDPASNRRREPDEPGIRTGTG